MNEVVFFIVDTNESPVHELEYSVPFVSVLNNRTDIVVPAQDAVRSEKLQNLNGSLCPRANRGTALERQFVRHSVQNWNPLTAVTI